MKMLLAALVFSTSVVPAYADSWVGKQLPNVFEAPGRSYVSANGYKDGKLTGFVVDCGNQPKVFQVTRHMFTPGRDYDPITLKIAVDGIPLPAELGVFENVRTAAGPDGELVFDYKITNEQALRLVTLFAEARKNIQILATNVNYSEIFEYSARGSAKAVSEMVAFCQPKNATADIENAPETAPVPVDGG